MPSFSIYGIPWFLKTMGGSHLGDLTSYLAVSGRSVTGAQEGVSE